MDLLDRLEMYQVMAKCFYERLSREEKMDALIEVTQILANEEQNGTDN